MTKQIGILVSVMSICFLIAAHLSADGKADPVSVPGFPNVENEIEFAVAEWPPMVSEDMVGFGKHAQRVMEIFSAMGYRVKFVFLSWPRSFELTKQGTYVATFPWLRTAERERDFLISKHAIAQAHHKGFYKASLFPNGLDLKSFDDSILLGLRPVVVASYWQELEFKKRGIEAEIVTSPEAAWRFLEAGRGDIMFEEEEVGWHDLKRIFSDEVVKTFATTEAITTDMLHILISRKHPDGLDLLRAFDAFMDSPDGQKMCQKWSFCRAGALADPDDFNGPESGPTDAYD
ncbi:MAG: transporter substrate-binding domain-containing protein [Rhodospirillales bacterium]|nr:transporter substrate-binding domain-containing protein [Rhodospirillales bacterium]